MSLKTNDCDLYKTKFVKISSAEKNIISYLWI